MTPRRSTIPIVVVLFFLIFSPTINILFADDAIGRALSQAFAGVFAVVFLSRYRLTGHGRVFVALMVLSVAAVVAMQPFVSQEIVTVRKLVGVLIVALLIPAAADDHPDAVRRLLIFTLTVNLIAVLFQLAGHTDQAYAHVTYANEATPVNLIALWDYLSDPIQVGFLPQLRPSGTFPAPTYLSLALILLWYALASEPAHRGRLGILGVGVLCILSGSSVGLFLAALSVVFLPMKGRLLYMAIGAAATMWLYATFAPWQFSFNFNVNEFITGFTARLDLDSGGESIIQQRPMLLAAGVFVAVLALVFAQRLNLFVLGRLAFVLFFPVMLHDVGNSLLYWMLVALALRSHTAIRFLESKGSPHATTETMTATPPVPE